MPGPTTAADGSQDKAKRRRIYFCIFIALWTIIQSGFHIYGLLLLTWWRRCVQTSNVDWDSYPTYLIDFIDISTECPNITMNVSEFDVVNFRTVTTKLVENATSEDSLKELLDQFIVAYIILDVLWIIASVALFMASCCGIKEFWALVFYFPWVALNVLILIFDAFCAIYFGLHIPDTGTFGDWLAFIQFTVGFSDLKELGDDLSFLVTGAASIMMTFISARGGIIWIVNLVFMIYIIRIAVRAYKEKFEEEQRRTKRRNNPLVYSASARIRNWYLFYGSLGKNEGKGNNNEDVFGERDETMDSSTQSREISNCDDEQQPHDHMTVLANQLPWSYVHGEGDVQALKAMHSAKSMKRPIGVKYPLEENECVSRF